MRWIFSVGMLTFLVVTGSGQDSGLYSSTEKEAFTAIFWEVKTYPSSRDSSLLKILKDFDITQARYAEIIRSGLLDDSAYSEGDGLKVRERVRVVNEIFEKEKSIFVKTTCFKHGLSVKLYNSILKAYRTDIAFQNSLRPYFNTHIQEER